MKTLVLLLVAASIPPVVAADCVGPVCATESSFADGTCAEGGSEGGATRVEFEGVAAVTGSWYCTGSMHESTLHASAAGSSAQWTEFGYSDPENGEFRGCFIAAGPVFEQCPAGVAPPNPGWGNVLP